MCVGVGVGLGTQWCNYMVPHKAIFIVMIFMEGAIVLRTR